MTEKKWQFESFEPEKQPQKDEKLVYETRVRGRTTIYRVSLRPNKNTGNDIIIPNFENLLKIIDALTSDIMVAEKLPELRPDSASKLEEKRKTMLQAKELFYQYYKILKAKRPMAQVEYKGKIFKVGRNDPPEFKQLLPQEALKSREKESPAEMEKPKKKPTKKPGQPLVPQPLVPSTEARELDLEPSYYLYLLDVAKPRIVQRRTERPRQPEVLQPKKPRKPKKQLTQQQRILQKKKRTRAELSPLQVVEIVKKAKKAKSDFESGNMQTAFELRMNPEYVVDRVLTPGRTDGPPERPVEPTTDAPPVDVFDKVWLDINLLYIRFQMTIRNLTVNYSLEFKPELLLKRDPGYALQQKLQLIATLWEDKDSSAVRQLYEDLQPFLFQEFYPTDKKAPNIEQLEKTFNFKRNNQLSVNSAFSYLHAYYVETRGNPFELEERVNIQLYDQLVDYVIAAIQKLCQLEDEYKTVLDPSKINTGFVSGAVDTEDTEENGENEDDTIDVMMQMITGILEKLKHLK